MKEETKYDAIRAGKGGVTGQIRASEGEAKDEQKYSLPTSTSLSSTAQTDDTAIRARFDRHCVNGEGSCLESS